MDDTSMMNESIDEGGTAKEFISNSLTEKIWGVVWVSFCFGFLTAYAINRFIYFLTYTIAFFFGKRIDIPKPINSIKNSLSLYNKYF